ncbi:MAG: hypothetical protein D3M94_06095 [Rhodocyclales bacterium GT-UBC]|nr:MAG: hypothetical protein D3M94_06095 [Rhodocyclales bacterium GT-UBC]
MRWSGLLLVLILAGCAEVEKQVEVKVEPESPVVLEKTESVEPKLKSSTLKYLANRNLKPQPTRPLNVRSKCSYRDAIGTTTKLDLLVKEAVVKNFDAQVTIKGYGSCRFNLKEFEQVEKLPQALLKHKKESGCLVRMWEQGPKVTVAFNSCAKSCEGQAFDYLWPIVVEAKSGRCY